MSKKFFMSVPDKHGDWLEDVKNKKGKSTIQDIVRDLITTAYEKDTKR